MTIRKVTTAGVAALGLVIALPAAEAVEEDGFRVEFVECPHCQYRMRFAADAKSATVNVCRLRDGASDEATLAERKRAAAKRALAILKDAADALKPRPHRPLMGWSSWNAFGVDISEDIILSVAEAMATNGLKAAGYRYVNLDDGFFGGHDANGRLKFHARRFPNGLKPVVDGIHALGLKAGIYSDAGSNTCGYVWCDDKLGEGAGLYGHDREDLTLHFDELGFDFIKVDYCGANRMGLDERERYTEIAEVLRSIRPDAVLNVCRWAYPGNWVAEVADSWRTTADIRARWSTVKWIISLNLYLGAYMSYGHYNDLDMLEVGVLKGAVKTAFDQDEGLTREEEATHFGMWCFLSSPLLIGCDARTVSAGTLRLVTNPFLLRMNQNDLAAAPLVAGREGEGYVLVKDALAEGGPSRYVALYNPSDHPLDFRVNFADLDLGGKVAAVDLGERAESGEAEGGVNVTVPAHGAKFYRLDAERRLETRVYQAEHAYLGEFQTLRDIREAGNATYEECSFASGGAYVKNLGSRPTNDLRFRKVRLFEDGEVQLVFRVATPEDRYLYVSVDGGESERLEVGATQGGAFTTVCLTNRLSAGEHEVRAFNPAARAPDVDSLRIVR